MFFSENSPRYGATRNCYKVKERPACEPVYGNGRTGAGERDSLPRRAYAWTGHYAVERAYATNGLNQYSAAGGTAFGYDANGNLTSDGSRTYVYDIENRLVSTSTGTALVYDPIDNRTSLRKLAGNILLFQGYARR